MDSFKEEDSSAMDLRSFFSIVVKYFQADRIVEIIPIDISLICKAPITWHNIFCDVFHICIYININIYWSVSILQKMKENSKGGKLKIVVLGNKAVGKSSIIRRYTLDDFSEDIQVLL